MFSSIRKLKQNNLHFSFPQKANPKKSASQGRRLMTYHDSGPSNIRILNHDVTSKEHKGDG